MWHPLLLASTPQPKSPAVNHVPSRVTVCAHVPSRMRHRGLSCCVRTHTHPFHHACISPLAVALLPHVSFRNTALTTTKATFDELMLHIKAADEILVNLGMTQNPNAPDLKQGTEIFEKIAEKVAWIKDLLTGIVGHTNDGITLVQDKVLFVSMGLLVATFVAFSLHMAVVVYDTWSLNQIATGQRKPRPGEPRVPPAACFGDFSGWLFD